MNVRPRIVALFRYRLHLGTKTLTRRDLRNFGILLNLIIVYSRSTTLTHALSHALPTYPRSLSTLSQHLSQHHGRPRCPLSPRTTTTRHPAAPNRTRRPARTRQRSTSARWSPRRIQRDGAAQFFATIREPSFRASRPGGSA